VRLEGHPSRTDTAASDTGTFRLHGTLGRAAALERVPLDLSASWTAAPLGAVSWIVLGRDLGVRGDLSATAAVKGTLGANQVQTTLTLRDARRADFVPPKSLDADIVCRAQGEETLHRLENIRCAWPLAGTSDAQQTGLVVTGELPELMRPSSVALQAQWNDVPAELLLDGLRILSPRVSERLTAAGVFSGTAACCGQPADGEPPVALTVAKAQLALGDAAPFLLGNVRGAGAEGKLTATLPLNLGGSLPASLALVADWSGYTLHLDGMVLRSRLLALAEALPPFGDGLEAVLPEPDAKSPETPFRVDATANHTWFNAQTWTAAPVAVRTPPRRTRRHRSS
jgi:AsmA protein